MLSSSLLRKPTLQTFCWSRVIPTIRILNRPINVSPCHQTSQHVIQCLSILGLGEGASQEDVRVKYLELAKRYHPDSKSPDASAEKFNKIFQSYQYLISNKSEAKDELEEEENDESGEKDFGIHHTAPQHRQFLEYGGGGFGTPSQRMKQYQQSKVEKAVDGVYEHQVKSFGAQASDLTLWEKKSIKKTRITKAINRLVEDLIQESMSKGEFDNLPGSGKPIEAKQVHHMDFTTAKVNQILVDSGFVPEWILLDKEIREEVQNLKKLVYERRTLYGAQPFTDKDYIKWQKELDFFEEKHTEINRKIDKFNMIVPILNKQRIHFHLQSHIDKVNVEYDPSLTDYQNENESKDELTLNLSEMAEKLKSKYVKIATYLNSRGHTNE